VDHVVVPLRGDHAAAFGALATGAAGAAGLSCPLVQAPHITLVAYSGLCRDAVGMAVRAALGTTGPFVVHAHAYGFFSGDEPRDLSLHVAVIRGAALDGVHGAVCAALHDGGATVAGWSEPELWSPHITLLGRGLDACRLGAAAAWLAQRHHPSWRIPVDRVLVTGGWGENDEPNVEIRLS
jgi:hypothetical protein